MNISTLPLNDGAIHYTDEHHNMTPAEMWEAWKAGNVCVFHMWEYQTRHNGYFTDHGTWHTYKQED